MSDALSSETPLNALKARVEAYNGIASIAYKLAAAAGAILTSLYLLTIDFFPQGLTPGEAIFFVFVTLAFGFVYLALLIFGAYSSVWIGHFLTYVTRLLRFRTKKPVAAIWPALRAHVRERRTRRGLLYAINLKIRRFRRAVTRSAEQDRSVVPKETRGPVLGVASFFVFFIMLVSALASGSKPAMELLFCFLLGGFVALSVLANPRHFPDQLKWIRWPIAIFLPLFVIVVLGKPVTLLHVVFHKLGIRTENVSIEVPDADLATFQRISMFVGHPILDCRRTPSGKLLLHGANVLWGGIGSQVLIEFAMASKKEGGWFDRESALLKKASLALDAKDIKIIRATPPLDPCFELPTDMLFETGKYELTAVAKAHLNELATSIRASGVPAELQVRGHSDPRPLAGELAATIGDNQRLSELRANAVAAELMRILNLPKNSIHSEGLGSREFKVKCSLTDALTRYEAEQCNKENRRVEVRVSLSQANDITSKPKPVQ